MDLINNIKKQSSPLSYKNSTNVLNQGHLQPIQRPIPQNQKSNLKHGLEVEESMSESEATGKVTYQNC